MRFLCIYTPARPSPEPPSQEMVQLIDSMQKDGTLLATGAYPTSKEFVHVRREGEELTVIDGPFTEAKEVVAGFAILKANSMAECIEMGKRFLKAAGEGVNEIRPLLDPPDHS